VDTTERGDRGWKEAQRQGWSEPAATNAPVEDEAVQPVLGMNQNHIRTAQIYIFSPTSTLPQNISPLPTYLPPPTSYLPLPTSPLLPPIAIARARAGAPQQSGSSGARALELEWERRSRSTRAGAGAPEPEH
jgi:hypothetical protein